MSRVKAGPPDNCVVWRMPMYLERDEDLQEEGLEESPIPGEAEGKKNKNEEDDYLSKKKKDMITKIEDFIATSGLDAEQLTASDLKCLVVAFHAREEAEKIYGCEHFKEILAAACEDFANYNSDIEELGSVMDVTLAEARDEFASDYEHSEWLCIAGELANMLHGGLT